MVAGGGADDAMGKLLRGEVHHLVVGTPELEAEDRLLVFTLEQDLVVQAPAEVLRRLQLGLDSDVVDPRCKYLFQVIGRSKVLAHQRPIISAGKKPPDLAIRGPIHQRRGGGDNRFNDRKQVATLSLPRALHGEYRYAVGPV